MAEDIKQIPKLITDVEPYFQYEGTANPTTQDQMQVFMKNEHSVIECLADKLWQPSTQYVLNHEVDSPNIPKGYRAKVIQAGISGSNEPDWGNGSADVTDGSIKWRLIKGNVTINGVAPDSNGNFVIDAYKLPIATSAEVQAGTNNTKAVTPAGVEAGLQNIGYWKANEAVTVGVVRFLKGAKYAGYYLKCTQAGTTGATQPTPVLGG